MTDLQFTNQISFNTKPRLFFCDVDRTLLTHDHVLLPVVSQAARSLCSVNSPFILASARSPTGLERVHSEVAASDIVCCFNGAWVGKLSTGETLMEERLDRSLAIEAMTVAHELSGSPIWFDLKQCFVLEPDEAVARQRTNVTGDPLKIINKPSEASGVPFKFLLTFSEERIEEQIAKLSAIFTNRLTVAQSGPTLVEIVCNDARKDLATTFIAKRLGLNGNEVAAAGDSENDLEMLRWAGLAITVANAKPHVQQLADIIAPSCDEGGLALALNWIVERWSA